MQTLILHNQQIDNIFDQYNLFGFGASSPNNSIIFDSIENITLQRFKLFSSKAKFNFLEINKFIEIIPSFLLLTEDYDKLKNDTKFQEIEATILRGHPYAQQLFFNDKKISEFLNSYLKINNSDKMKGNCEAFVHIGSLRERFIEIHSIEPIDKSLANITPHIQEQLKYFFANIYHAMISELKFDATKQIDKSIYLKVNFFVDTSVDIDIQIGNITLIDINNFSNYHNFNTLLEYIYNDLLYIKQERNAVIGSNNNNYIRACRELNVTCEPIARNMYFLKKDLKKAVYIPYHRTVQSKEAIDRAESKVTTNEILKKQNYKVSKHINVSINDIDTKKVDKIFKDLKAPLVIKPTDQSAGYGVYLNITNKELFSKTIEEMKTLDKVNELIIEEQFEGTLYRFIVLGDKVEAVIKSSYPIICGNGIDTLEKLVREYNRLNIRKIRIDDSMKMYLSSIGITPKTIIEKGKSVIVSLKKNGDVTQNVTDFVNQKYKDIAIEVNRAIDLNVNGVDMMISKDGDYRIIELNPVPALYPHLAPNYGESLDVFKKVISYVLENASNDFHNCSDIYNYHN